MSRLKKEWKVMWANVWFRSLIELILVVIGAVLFVLLVPGIETGKQAFDQVKQLMGLPTEF